MASALTEGVRCRAQLQGHQLDQRGQDLGAQGGHPFSSPMYGRALGR